MAVSISETYFFHHIAIKDNQKEADRAKDSYDRSDDVNLALENACATGSIKLLKSVLLWTESFLRDPVSCCLRAICSSSLLIPHFILVVTNCWDIQ